MIEQLARPHPACSRCFTIANPGNIQNSPTIRPYRDKQQFVTHNQEQRRSSINNPTRNVTQSHFYLVFHQKDYSCSWEIDPRMSTNREGGSCARKLAAFSLVLEFQTHSQSNDHQQLLRRSIRVYGTIMAGPRARDRERAWAKQTPPSHHVYVERVPQDSR